MTVHPFVVIAVLILLFIAVFFLGLFAEIYRRRIYKSDEPNRQSSAAAQQSDESWRERLGGNVIKWSSWALVGISIAVLTTAVATSAMGGPEDKKAALETSRWVFAALLPLFGTWVGTVLAFYFSKDNFKAANEATKDLVKLTSDRLSETKVTDAMIPETSIMGKVTAPENVLGNTSLKEISEAFRDAKIGGKRPITRLLIRTPSNGCRAVLHRSTWHEMLKVAREPSAADPDKQTVDFDIKTDTLEKLLDLKTEFHEDMSFESFLTGYIAYIGADRSLADAKARMEAHNGCQDVIVTETGNPDEPIVGWITNVEISMALKA
ncbi:MAG: hypothetical protein AAGJ28_20000 [Pseudomonadota bacterium]